MSCFYPYGVKLNNGEIINVPCGRCYGCRLDKAKDWALRCVHEAQMNDENSFITLTYNNENLPEDHSINKRHLQLFIKRLRSAINPTKIRYYACGEYGENLGRPHYHALIFGYDFPDKQLLFVSNKTGKFGNPSTTNGIYKSESLEKIWGMGMCSIGEVTLQSAGYVARYIRKKITGDMATDHYKGRTPEFALMSRRPGIGTTWITKFKYDVYPKDWVQHEGRRCRPSRFYDNKLKRINWKMYEEIKNNRKERIKEDDIIRRRQKEKYLKNITKNLTRSD